MKKVESEEEDDDDDDDDEYGSEEEAEESQFDLKKVFSNILPMFLFKWNGDISIEPDLKDI